MYAISETEKYYNEIKTLEEKEINNYNYISLFLCSIFNNKSLSFDKIKEYENFMVQIPLHYLDIELCENKTMNFKFFHKFYEKIIEEKIEFETEKGVLSKLLKDKQFPRTFYGICFEKIIILLIKNNKMNLNIYFDKKIL